MNLRRHVGAVLAVVATLVLVACASEQPRIQAPSNSEVSPQEIVQVIRTDLTPVLTVDSSVRSKVRFQVSAQAAGTVSWDNKKGMVLAGDDGSQQNIPISVGFADYEPLVATGSRVAANTPVLAVTYQGLVMWANLTPPQTLRFLTRPVSARAQLVGGSGGFDCSLLSLQPSTSQTGSPEGSSFIVCAIPDDVPALVGMEGLLAVRFPTAEQVLALPLSAVLGSGNSGSVLKQTDGEPMEVAVKLGANDGQRIEISGEISEGDYVLIPGPKL